jgi:hypothetical protein
MIIIKQNNQAHESNRRTTMVLEGEGGGGLKHITEDLNMIKVHYMHMWKCHDEPT